MTWDEFWAEMSKHSSYFGASANGLTNKVACTIAHDVMDACKPELKNATAVTGNRMMFKLRVKLASGMCRAGLASFSEYKTETCVAAATSCEEAARCYADDEEEDDEEAEDAAEKPATLQRRSTRALQRLTKRDAAVWEVMYWVSMAILGVVSLGSIILFPFWVILLIVSLRTMDFKKLDQ